MLYNLWSAKLGNLLPISLEPKIYRSPYVFVKALEGSLLKWKGISSSSAPTAQSHHLIPRFLFHSIFPFVDFSCLISQTWIQSKTCQQLFQESHIKHFFWKNQVFWSERSKQTAQILYYNLYYTLYYNYHPLFRNTVNQIEAAQKKLMKKVLDKLGELPTEVSMPQPFIQVAAEAKKNSSKPSFNQQCGKPDKMLARKISQELLRIQWT